ncbi:MAG TPA: helix-turn-helix transcriptional regulator, partial [Gemmatimonadaceae bacterium]|nr:helix-turn-helix transcriptional regulator [Gemmatimonadaceae bacterium]
PSLGQLAESVGLSRFQLLRRFTSRYGVPPHAWLLNRRAELARQLIAGGEPLSMAALQSGFADQSHMTRTFVKFYGFTPGSWQRMHHGFRTASPAITRQNHD